MTIAYMVKVDHIQKKVLNLGVNSIYSTKFSKVALVDFQYANLS